MKDAQNLFTNMEVVDFHSKLLAFRGASGEPNSFVSLLSVSSARCDSLESRTLEKWV